MTAPEVGEQAGGGGPTTCYRHPKREAGVRCVRCERYICGECMIPAAVGFQCPECVREGNKTLRHSRTIAGARVNAAAGRITYVLIAANVAVFLLQQVQALIPLHYGALGSACWRAFDSSTGSISVQCGGVAYGEWYRLVTGAFIHAGWLHIGLNMYALFLMGPTLERVLGPVRFVVLYFASAIAGNILAVILNPHAPAVGASGAIFGLFAAYLIIARRLRADTSQILVVIGINLVLSFTLSGVSWQGHIGGLVAGAATAAVMVYAPQRNRGLIQAAGSVAVLVVMFAVLLAFMPAKL